MKRFLSLLLAFAVCFTLLATTSLAYDPGEYTQNPKDYEQMLDCVNKGSYNIQLTQEYFAINPTKYNKGNYCKFQFESDGAEVQAAVFLMPGEILSLSGESTTLLKKTPIAFSRDDSQELNCSLNNRAVSMGAYFGFNILTTSLSVDTTITVSVFCTNTGNGTFEKVDEITYELKAAVQASDEALGMSVECADRSGTEDGKQVYAGDTVTVSSRERMNLPEPVLCSPLTTRLSSSAVPPMSGLSRMTEAISMKKAILHPMTWENLCSR